MISFKESMKRYQTNLKPSWQWIIGGIALVVAIVIAFTGSGDQTQTLFSICLFAVLAYAWNIISGMTGYISFGQIGFFGIGAYVAAICQLQLNSDWYVAALAGGLVALLIAIPLGVIMLRLQGIYFALGMLGLARIGQLIASSSALVGGSQGESVPVVGTPQATSLVMIFVVVAALALTWWLLHARLGLCLMAIRDDEMATQASGINTTFYKVTAFCISSFLAGLAGGLYTWNIGFIDPGSAFNSTFELQTILMVLIGGIGTLWGPLLGAIIVSIIGQALWAQFPQQQQIILGALTLIAVVWMPGGIVSLLNKRGWLRRTPVWATSRREDIPDMPDLSRPTDIPEVPGVSRPAESRGANILEVPDLSWHLADLSAPGSAKSEAPGSATSEAQQTRATVLKCNGLTRRFGGLSALSNCAIQVEAGQIVAVIGPNGAGKTTLFNLITGFDRPSEGDISFLEHSITGHAPYRIAREGVARTFQTSRPFPSLTAWETLLLAAIAKNPSRSKATAQASSMLNKLHLSEQWNNSPEHLPPGQRRLLEIGRALMLQPRVLLLDEAMAGMAPDEIALVHALLKEVVSRGCSVVAIEHVLPAITPIAQHIYVLDFGVTIAEGAAQEVLGNPIVVDAYLGTGEKESINA
ncbi:MAG TPA: branched-chain amino acid ABC transporter ATP-binding protein/permease [Ktedonosporobacter sp.]|nr:branched-chain amino acid ABC transporter ATP-binding protein/permease [Ktedonosporobacter sp.]